MPPSGPQYGQWDLSPGMKEEMDAVREGIFGKAGANFTMSGYRICWLVITIAVRVQFTHFTLLGMVLLPTKAL